MMLTRTGLVVLAVAGSLPQVAVAAPNSTNRSSILSLVDPLIGTTNGGHVFPGATLPFGMAKAVADVNVENQGGFSTGDVTGNITGFSHMHDSGTGGSPSLGNFPLFPQTACPGDLIDNCVFPIQDRAVPRINGTAEAHPGYFAVTMENKIHTEMTVNNHTALYRFTFPEASSTSNSTISPLILADLIDLPQSRINGSVSVDAQTGRISGSGVFSPSFGIGNYALHFCADFSGADVRDTGVFQNNRAGTDPKKLSVVNDGVNNSPDILPAGAWTRFHAPKRNNQILARVGVSFISDQQACHNAEREIPHFDFAGVLAAAEKAWEDTLGVIQVKPGGVNESLQTVFWSGVYRAGISPQDYTGENPLWKSSEPYYDSYYCIWDSFRSIHSLITIVDPYSQIQMIRSLIEIYRQEGWLPDCRMSLCKGFTQGGSNADVVLADTYVKFGKLAAEYGVDWKTAYEALVQDAEYEPANWAVEGRGGLHSWRSLHYIPTDDYDPYGVGPFTRSISRTVEYAYDDYCIAEVARGLGNHGDYEKYIGTSEYWKNMWKADQNSSINGTDTGFTGFLMPKFLNGTWGFQDPIFCSPLLNFTSCYLNPDGHETYEGSSWLYSFFVPHDQAALITTMGGPSTFVKRLDYLHESGLLYIGDEQGFLPVFQYHYAGRPGKSAERAHFYIPSQFNDTISGIPGNDDSGAMGSFVALTMMGIFPNPGQDIYFITPPFFEEVSIRNKLTGKTATIRNINFDASYQNIYIQSARLNGRPYTKNYIQHSFFLEGGILELTLGRNESSWGTRPEDLPPSLSTGHNITGYMF
ncbi:glycoside hydrolase family 92 protein [Zasmidium cellare ATCC 36951]|uniref:Glycoside hydrolase family 92 protein n=1 Tax=Zasmidium cellare ATCC 36951 TaxID=1080233 RepID=A0A6A6CNC0_ZASCE|nr:glycoside hydrolase family 92 protein [Zasmidium cellare ATCC 36951]KAF2166956.1 glycoside hydrolase family 92 protein [Zasmidium cellare ATCC 36951]